MPPAYARAGSSTEDELLGPWLWDELAAEDGEPAAAPPPGHPQYNRRPRRRQLVYLDDYAPKLAAESGAGGAAAQGRAGGGYGPKLRRSDASDASAGVFGEGRQHEDDDDGETLSMRGSAALNHQFRQQLSMLRDPAFDHEVWLFRTGRFRSSG